jgi:hypothetical protein
MAGLVPAIHVLFAEVAFAWMPGTSPGMTIEDNQVPAAGCRGFMAQ